MSLAPPKKLKKSLKTQYFPPIAVPKSLATFTELPGSATEPFGAAQMLPGGPSGAPAPTRAESGQPQNWSLTISSLEKSMENQYFLSRTLPKPLATFPELPGSARKLSRAAEMLFGGLSSAQAPARAETGRPQNWSPAFFLY